MMQRYNRKDRMSSGIHKILYLATSRVLSGKHATAEFVRETVNEKAEST